MNFRNLQYFLAVTEEKNITRAAERLYISQQSLSGHIAKLESELGVRLFERGQELKLTYAGERLALIAGRICDLEQEIFRETGEISGNRRGRLRLGISHTCGRAILPAILPEFCTEHPLVEINLMEGNHNQLNEWLSRGEIDVLIGYMPIDVDGAEVHPFLTERLFLVCPKDLAKGLEEKRCAESENTKRAKGKELSDCRNDDRSTENSFLSGQIDIKDFSGLPFILLKKGNRIRAMFDNYLAKSDFLPEVLLETENIETAFSLSARGMGVTVYPELFLDTLHPWAFDQDSQLELYPLPGDETVGSLAVAYLESGYHSPAILDFIALCRRKYGAI